MYVPYWPLTQVRGAGCATCGRTNQRTTYSQQGQVTSQSQLDSNGQIVQSVLTEYDSSGRPTQISQQRVLDGRAQPAQWQVRYRYANASSQQPSQVARPSVVAGQEYQVSVSYNPQGQLTQQTETGFSPLDGKGQIAATPAQTGFFRAVNTAKQSFRDSPGISTDSRNYPTCRRASPAPAHRFRVRRGLFDDSPEAYGHGAFASARHVVSQDIGNQRLAAFSLEPRSVLAAFTSGGHLHRLCY